MKAEPSNVVALTFNTKVTQEEAKQILGDEFHRRAFGQMIIEHRDSGEGSTSVDIPVFDYSEKQLDVVLEKHVMKVLGGRFVVAPELVKVVPVKGERAVWLTLRVKVLAAQKYDELIGSLHRKFNLLVDVSFAVEQGDLFEGDDVDGEEAEAGEGEEGAVVTTKTGRWGNPETTVA